MSCSTSTFPNSTPTPSTTLPAHWIWHTPLSSASRPRFSPPNGDFFDSLLSWYTVLMAIALPLAFLIFFFTPPDRGFRPRELDDMPPENDMIEAKGDAGYSDADGAADDENSENGSARAQAGSTSARTRSEQSSESGTNTDSHSGSNAGSDGSSSPHSQLHSEHPSDREWDDSPEEWADAAQQHNKPSCHPQLSAWARELNP